jgi:transcriptional regulator with XRE-family HTH domain
MTQIDLARAIGYEQAYLSSLELGMKNPSQEFMARLIEKVQLSNEERDELMSELAASRTRFSLPPDVSTETFRFCSALWEKIDRLHPALLSAMHAMLTVEDQVANRARHQPKRLRRRQSREAQM